MLGNILELVKTWLKHTNTRLHPWRENKKRVNSQFYTTRFIREREEKEDLIPRLYRTIFAREYLVNIF